MAKGLTVIEASKLVGKSRETIYHWKNKGLIELDENNMITLESILKMKDNPLKTGRPSGTFKRGVKTDVKG